jgi:hypothetical protein
VYDTQRDQRPEYSNRDYKIYFGIHSLSNLWLRDGFNIIFGYIKRLFHHSFFVSLSVFLPYRAVPTAVSRLLSCDRCHGVCVCVCVWFIPNPTLPMAPSVLAGQRTCVMSDKLNHETVNNWNQSVIRFHESPSLPIAIHMYVMMRHDSQSSLQTFSCMCKWFIKHSVTSWIQFIKFTKKKKKFSSHFIRGCYGCYPCWHNVLVTAFVRFIADWL